MAVKKRRKGPVVENEIINLTNVSKAYSTGAPALKDVNLHISRGEFVFIVGDRFCRPQRIGKIYPDQASAEGAYDQQRLHQCDGL